MLPEGFPLKITHCGWDQGIQRQGWVSIETKNVENKIVFTCNVKIKSLITIMLTII